MDKKIFLIFFIVLNIIVIQVYAIENPKNVDYIKLKIIKSGKLVPSGRISYANLSLQIPQNRNSIEVKIYPENVKSSHQIIKDMYGNDILLIKIDSFDKTVSYRVETIVENHAFSFYSSAGIGHNSTFLRQTDKIIFSNEMVNFAYPFEKTLKNVAALTSFVNQYVNYDLNLMGEDKSSEWVFENRKGVCVEYANLLTALLRISSIPTRYINGYSYSLKEGKFVGHTWVEVLLEDGTWVPFDPTWLEGGYLDATHIKTASLLDNSQRDILNYKGYGKIDWQIDDEEFVIFDYSEKGRPQFSFTASKSPINGYGIIKSNIKTDDCRLVSIELASCLDKNGNEFLDIFGKKRFLWVCGSENVYWVFKPRGSLDKNYEYTCPISYVVDAVSGNFETKVKGSYERKNISIEGPETVAVGEEFTLNALCNDDCYFFSASEVYPKNVKLSLKRPGNYTFYLYSEHNFEQKNINVIGNFGFEMNISFPENIQEDSKFDINITLTNLYQESRNFKVKVYLDNVYEKSVYIKPGESKEIGFETLLTEPGRKKLIISVESNGLKSYEYEINVVENKDMFGTVFDFFSSIINWLSEIFRGS